MFKKIQSIFICTILLFCFSMPVSAAGQISSVTYNSVQRYSHINYVSSSIDISGRVAQVSSFIDCHLDNAQIFISATLQKYTNGYWSNVPGAYWSTSSTGLISFAGGSWSISSGTYRVQTYYSVYCEGETESDTIYSVTKSC